MKKIYEFLKNAENEKSYQRVFGYKDSKLKPKLSLADQKEVEDQQSEFAKNKLMKIIASRNFDKKISLEDAYWIIKDWGGIRSFKRNERNQDKIERFLSKIGKDDLNLSGEEFDTLSSLSKLSFFYDIEKYCIYDSRVVYSLNWIIFKSKENSLKFFPPPKGRNKTIVNYPIDAIIKFSLRERKLITSSNHYYSHNEAYQRYNMLMKDLSSKIYGEEIYPFYAEMLLFGIADTYVNEDIKKEIEIRIKSWA